MKINRYLIMAMMMLPMFSHAENFFEPAEGSKAMVLLASLFGQLGIFGTSGSDPFSQVIGTFLGGVLMIGGILVTYTIFAGTLGTAHDGEMLGKKFSSVWLPIRTAMGTALVLPVINGYCLMQLMVGWLIVQGIGLADKTWASFVSTSNIVNVATAGLQQPEAKELGSKVFQSLVCIEAMNAITQNSEIRTLTPNINFGTTVEDGLLTRTIKFGNTTNTGTYRNDVCGTVEIAKFQMPTLQSSSIIDSIPKKVMDSSTAIQRTQGIVEEHYNQVNTLINNLRPLAQTLVQTGQPIPSSSIDSAVAIYEASMRQKAGEEILRLEPFKEVSANASQDGFLMAGAWFIKLSYMSDLVNRSMANVPTATGMRTDGGILFGEELAKSFPAVYDTLKNTRAGSTSFAVGNEVGGSNTTWWNTIKESVSGGLDPVPLMKKAFTSGTNFAIQDGEHPLMAMKRLGNWLLGISSTSYVIGVGLMSSVGNAPGIGMSMMMTMFMILPIFLITGFTLSYLLPMLPFMLWLGAIVGWLILCIEAIFAAPIWAVMHLHPQGDDVSGKGANGYNLVLSLMLRPVLMIFGLISAIILLDVFGQFTNNIFSDVFAVSQQDSGFFVWIGAFIAGPIIYCIVMFFVIKKMFTVMYQIPDQLLNWFSGGGAQLGKSAESIGGTHAYYAASGGMQQALGKGEQTRQLMNLNKEAVKKNMSDKSAQESNRMSSLNKMDEDIGVGASAVAQFAENKAGGAFTEQGSYAMQKAHKDLSIAVDQVGGKDSIGGAAFMSRLNEGIKKEPDKDLNHHIGQALSSGLDAQYGQGAGQMATMIGGNHTTPEYNRAVMTYKDMYQSLKDKGMDEFQIKDTMQQSISSAVSEYHNDNSSTKNGGTKTPQSYLAKEFESLKRN